MGPILPGPLADILVGRRLTRDGGNGSGGSRGCGDGSYRGTAIKSKNVGVPGVEAWVQVRYNA